MRNDRACLLDILDAIAGIEKYSSNRQSFDGDERTQAWMVSRLQIIGEASRHLTSEFRERHTDVPWRLIIGMRHHLVHGYFDIDPDVVWAAITERVPEPKRDVEQILATDIAVQDDV